MARTTPRWLEPDEMRAWRAFVDAQAAVSAGTEADLMASHGLSAGEYAVLVHLSESPDDGVRMCDLAEALHLSPSGLTRRVDAMVRSGLVRREPWTEDRRVMRAVLTPEGRARLERAAPDHVASVRRHFVDRLSTTQLLDLADALRAIAPERVDRVGRPVRR